MRRISKKKSRQQYQERKLIPKLLERCQGLCEECGRLPDFRGLSKHEIIFRKSYSAVRAETLQMRITVLCYAEGAMQ